MSTAARTLAEAVERIYGHTRPDGGCLLSTRKLKGRSERERRIFTRFRGKLWMAHQIVAEHALGPCPEGLVVRHLCGRAHEGCVTASHLRYEARWGTDTRGTRHGRARLTEEDVHEIRRMRCKVSREEMARRLGVSVGCITSVLTGDTWSWLQTADEPTREEARKGLNRGSRAGNAKLGEADVHEIRRLRGRVTQREMAGRFGVSAHTIKAVLDGKNWGWLPREEGSR